MQQDTVNGQKHIDWTSLIHLDTQQTKLNNVGLYVFLFVHFEFIRFLFFCGGGDQCVVFQVILSYESFVYNNAVKSAQLSLF